jgi:RNA polymerase sigma factor (sigma-70 family)
LLERASDARQLQHCMQDLTAPQRQSVALAFFDGLSHAEVAAQLCQPLGTVKSWVRRALATLKGCLERAAQGDGAMGI